ncbi:MAG: carbohydrate binding domain-containing protein [Fibrobacteria bacterium]|nr:carbohydrate binding domain-containing protein [Fibrobacteria bacterium]
MIRSPLVLGVACLVAISATAGAAPVIAVHADQPGHAINPAIYGINALSTGKATYLAADSALLGSDRMGGNRMTAYNWENNYSSAGSDWQFNSDNWLTQNPLPTPTGPGGSVANFVERNLGLGRAPIVQLQMAGFVAADGAGPVTADQIAPSSRWKRVAFAKGSPFTLAPSTTDSFVYMDEEVNFLVQKFGRADQGGVPYYSLDNEPALWGGTHVRLRPAPLTFQELLDKSEALAKAVKAVDPSAKIMGSESFGAMAMWGCYSGTPNSIAACSDWPTYKAKYDWAVAAFLGEMKARSTAAGIQLIDVLAIHWYPEDMGDARISNGSVADGGTTKDIEARLQAPRGLWDTTYLENSWIPGAMTGNKPVAILARTKQSIDTAWPGMRLALTEYNYGGENHWSGALALADALGVFGKLDLEAANLHTTFSGHLEAAFRLYRNIDGKGNGFGDTHVAADNPDPATFSTYASLDSRNPNLLHVIAINKSATAQPVTLSLSGKEWKSAVAYGFSTDSVISRLPDPAGVSATGFEYTLPATSAIHFVVSTDAQVVLPALDLVPLTVEIVGQGTVTRSLRTSLVPRGTVVTLDATPAEGWNFGGWSGDGSGSSSSLAVTMDAPRIVQAVFLSASNLIVNGDFSDGTTGWTPSAWSEDGTAAGTPSVREGAFTFEVTNGGTEGWNVQIFQTAVPFVKGTTYTLSFDASASQARTINVYANLGAFDKSVSLGTASKRYSYTFVSDSTQSGKLSFDIGGKSAAGTTVTLDNVSIVSASTAIRPVSKPGTPALWQSGNRLVSRGVGELQVRDLKGRRILSRQVSGESILELAHLPRGIFFAQFQGSQVLVRHLD